jgi:hypothetical protein
VIAAIDHILDRSLLIEHLNHLILMHRILICPIHELHVKDSRAILTPVLVINLLIRVIAVLLINHVLEIEL